ARQLRLGIEKAQQRGQAVAHTLAPGALRGICLQHRFPRLGYTPVEGRKKAVLAPVEQLVERASCDAGARHDRRDRGAEVSILGGHLDHRRQDAGTLDVGDLLAWPSGRLPAGARAPRSIEAGRGVLARRQFLRAARLGVGQRRFLPFFFALRALCLRQPVGEIWVLVWMTAPFCATNEVGIVSFVVVQRFLLAANAESWPWGRSSSKVPTGTSGIVLKVLLVMPALLMNVEPIRCTVAP